MPRFTAPRTRRAGLLAVALATAVLSTVVAPPASATTCLDGTGTSLDPFLVASAADLAKVGSGTDGCDRDAHYLQTADITLTSDHTPIGSLGSAFTGTYDGGGLTIAGLVIDLPTTDDVGLFGNTNGATIRRVNVTGADVTGRDDTGMLVGSGSDTTIVDSSATGSVTGTDFVGGLLGYGPGALVLRSWSAGSVSGVDDVGGLIGYLPFGGLRSSFSTADVTSSGGGSSHVGGLIGYFPGLTSTTPARRRVRDRDLVEGHVHRRRRRVPLDAHAGPRRGGDRDGKRIQLLQRLGRHVHPGGRRQQHRDLVP